MPFRPSRQTIVPLIVAAALFMQNLDSTVIATALPEIARSLAEDPLRLNLAITSYLLSVAIFIPMSGWTADRYGARTVFALAIAVFTAGSIACGAASSLPELVAARVLQGIGGAMMVPVGRLAMLRTIPRSEYLRAMSFLTAPALLGPVIGPPLGGFIVTYGSWRWIFLINVPVGILGIALVLLFIENVREPEETPLDLRGFGLAAVGLSGLMFGFETAGRGTLPWSWVASLLAVGTIATALYLVHARRAAYPIIDLKLLRIPTFAASNLGGTLFRIGMGAMPFLLPLMMQLGFGMSAFGSGLVTFASAAGAMTMRLTATPAIRKLGFRRVLVGNAAVNAVFIMANALFTPQTPYLVIVAILLAGGFFRSLQFTCINTLGYADIPSPLMSRASSFASMAQQLSASLGVATGALLLHVTLLWRGGAQLEARDFAPAFVAIALISLLSLVSFIPLAANAGAQITGRRVAAEPTPRKASGD